MKSAASFLLVVALVGPSVTQELQAESSKPGTNTGGTIEKLTPHFRNAFWGDSRKQVMEKETAELVLSKNGLVYKTELAGVPVFVVYVFEDDKLVRTIYAGKQKYSQAENYLNDYAKFKQLLTAKYGNPEVDEELWSDNLFRKSRDSSDRAMALKIGHLTLHSEWHTADTEITLMVWGKEFEVNFHVGYDSKELRYLLDRKEQREEEDVLSDF